MSILDYRSVSFALLDCTFKPQTIERCQAMTFSKELFKEDYRTHGKDNLTAQLSHLDQLAELYIQRAEEHGDWVNYVKVSDR